MYDRPWWFEHCVLDGGTLYGTICRTSTLYDINIAPRARHIEYEDIISQKGETHAKPGRYTGAHVYRVDGTILVGSCVRGFLCEIYGEGFRAGWYAYK